ncbi:hypothetical protein I6A84_18695 [Frankia sp. CNm7]|uniref:Uncharacterized protein n=1 Tax=Frankia nepalensis TaxID=1836974 RepID=A0A937UPI9_9ACTN|nr:hypothetical protein [Frankia nepalensis]MBL7502554.1 hypothetical protein [Frankia nepalensis]MBL7511742.1 hypothetical protein [Frankia nepalensis]MBL7520064.1 hypothetical protein [Frankia nepalensis]MBL7629128.1 hypothetical protein [Frankia nepalensis]
MRWVLVDVALIVGSLLVMVLCALALWRKVRTVRATADELKERVSGLSAETTALSARIDTAEVMGRLADRSAG